MPSDTIEIVLRGKKYYVACAEEEREGLLETADFLDTKLREAGECSHASGEKLWLMTALNLAHDFLQLQRAGGFDMPTFKRRMNAINQRLNQALQQQEKLF